MKLLLRSFTIGKYRISFAAILWFSLALIAVVAEVLRGKNSVNNYFIYESVFRHTLSKSNLYLAYPSEYNDVNHYGPVFGLLIAPFSFFPWWLGCILWCLANAWFLYYAVRKMPLSSRQHQLILLITAIEMMTSLHNVQFNPMLTAWIILAFVLVNKEKDGAATFFIAAGFLIKLYGIIALVTFLFSRHRLKFVIYFALWIIVLICLPMLISSPRFVLQSYMDWYHTLVEKNAENAAGTLTSGMQDISVSGMIRRILQNPYFPQLSVLIPAALLYLLPLLRFKDYRSALFQFLYLAVSLVTVVIFSSSAESPTYVIAVAGVAIWFVLQPYPPQKWVLTILVFVLLLTSLSPTDLFPPYVRKHVITKYSLKVLPCFVAWLAIVWQLLGRRFYPQNETSLIAAST